MNKVNFSVINGIIKICRESSKTRDWLKDYVVGSFNLHANDARAHIAFAIRSKLLEPTGNKFLSTQAALNAITSPQDRT